MSPENLDRPVRPMVPGSLETPCPPPPPGPVGRAVPVRPKAVVAMSGGVDSSVAAALMKDAGYDVVGIMLKLWRGAAASNESGCCSLDAAEDARRVAQVLDIPFYVFNFAERFERTVVASFVEGYAAGRTPNPCIDCNRWIKFSALLERARAVGADVLATGHYARIGGDGERRRLLRGRDPGKDQSYVLHMLGQDELRSAMFPVGEHAKPEVRAIAASLGLRTAGKPESQDLCFVPAGDTHAFLGEAVGAGSAPGPILSLAGERIGTHRGFAHYTVGQRRGLGLGGRGGGLPLFVHSVRPADNAVVVATREQMHARTLELEDVSFVAGEPPRDGRGATAGTAFGATVMTRYRGPEAAAVVDRGPGGRWRVVFDEPQRIVAPGQAAVFYRGDEVLGGGAVAAS